MASISQSTTHTSKTLASDHLRSSTGSVTGAPLRDLGRSKLRFSKRSDFTVVAKLRKIRKHEYPWPEDPDPNVRGGVLSHLSGFKPLTERVKPVTLDFEKPLIDLQKKIIDVRNMADETGLDFTDQISLLETKYQQMIINVTYYSLRPRIFDIYKKSKK